MLRRALPLADLPSHGSGHGRFAEPARFSELGAKDWVAAGDGQLRNRSPSTRFYALLATCYHPQRAACFVGLCTLLARYSDEARKFCVRPPVCNLCCRFHVWTSDSPGSMEHTSLP